MTWPVTLTWWFRGVMVIDSGRIPGIGRKCLIWSPWPNPAQPPTLDRWRPPTFVCTCSCLLIRSTRLSQRAYCIGILFRPCEREKSWGTQSKRSLQRSRRSSREPLYYLRQTSSCWSVMELTNASKLTRLLRQPRVGARRVSIAPLFLRRVAWARHAGRNTQKC